VLFAVFNLLLKPFTWFRLVKWRKEKEENPPLPKVGKFAAVVGGGGGTGARSSVGPPQQPPQMQVSVSKRGQKSKAGRAGNTALNNVDPDARDSVDTDVAATASAPLPPLTAVEIEAAKQERKVAADEALERAEAEAGNYVDVFLGQRITIVLEVPPPVDPRVRANGRFFTTTRPRRRSPTPSLAHTR
jgi:hypothetical protein